MRFSGIVTPGDLLIAISILISVLGAYNRIMTKLAVIEQKVAPVYCWWDRHINSGTGPDREYTHGQPQEGAD